MGSDSRNLIMAIKGQLVSLPLPPVQTLHIRYWPLLLSVIIPVAQAFYALVYRDISVIAVMLSRKPRVTPPNSISHQRAEP
jgi:hypothetical protein